MTSKIIRRLSLVLFCCIAALHAQPPAGNQTQQLSFAGLRAAGMQGQFRQVGADATGNLYLLMDQNDGVRILKTDNAATTVLAQVQLGAAGDHGIALALDPQGNVYVVGTTSSNAFSATSGVAFGARTDASVNGFLARFDGALQTVFVTFTGGSRIAPTAVSATADAVFVTGITYAGNLPITSGGLQQSPAPGSTQNGFVERFTTSGTALVYATYLTGANGDTTPSAIVANADDQAFIAGATSSPGYPTVNALIPNSLSASSGFLSRLTAQGDSFVFSTFIPGGGITSLTLAPGGTSLFASGTVAFSDFPVDQVASTLVPMDYQVLLHLPLDSASVLSATALVPGNQSFLAADTSGAIWVDGDLSFPLLPIPTLAQFGQSFAIRASASGGKYIVDQTARFGGLATTNANFASLPLHLTGIAISTANQPVVAGTLSPTASANLLPTQTFTLPLFNAPTAALPSSVHDAEQSQASCNGSLCAGSAGYLAKLNSSQSLPALSVSADDLPFLTVQNLGSAAAQSLHATDTANGLTTNCPATLGPGASCTYLLSSGQAGIFTLSAANATSQSIAHTAYSTGAANLTINPLELDFGIQTAGTTDNLRTLTMTNLGTTTQTFTSGVDSSSRIASLFSERSSDCPLDASGIRKSLAPGSSCSITLAFSAPSTSGNDGPALAFWSVGGRAIQLSGYGQFAALSLSSSSLNFGTQFATQTRTGIHLPRFLYISNASTSPVPHALVSSPNGSPFTVTDFCPTTLQAGSVCQVRVDYLAAQAPVNDSATLLLDQGQTVLLTGQTLPPRGTTGASANPNLNIAPAAIAFSDPVPVTGVSAQTLTVAITNTGTTSFPITLALSGDFTSATSCGSTLAAGATCAVTLTFVPAQPGPRNGLLTITAGSAFTPVYVALSGTASAILPPNNGTLQLGASPLNQPVTVSYKVAQPLSSLTVMATGPYTVALLEDQGYGPGTAPASAFAQTASGPCRNCFLVFRFLPVQAGTQNGTVTLRSAPGGSSYALNLAGTGQPSSGLLLNPTAQDFGAVAVGSASAPVAFTLTNQAADGNAVSIAMPTLSGDFHFSTNNQAGPACGGSLAFGATCSVPVVFTPTSAGARVGTLTLADPAQSVTAQLSGNAAATDVLLSPSALLFQNGSLSSATQQTVTITNQTSQPIQFGQLSVTSAAFTFATNCAALAPAAQCQVAVTFHPGAAIVNDALQILVSVMGTVSARSVALAGAYTASTAGLLVSPSTSNYGSTAVGMAGAIRQIVISNATLKTLSLTLNIPRDFSLIGNGCPQLAPVSACTLSIQFNPLLQGDISGTLIVQAVPSDGSATITSLAYVEAFGTGTGTLLVTNPGLTANLLNFGQVTSGQSVLQTVLLQNTSATATVTVRRITSAPPFLATSTCGRALAPHATCAVTVTYAPLNQISSSGAAAATSDSGTLTIESDAITSPNQIHLSGQAGPVTVANPSNAPPLATETLSTGSLTFAPVSVGNRGNPQLVILTNTGTRTLTIFSITPPPDFSAQSDCTQLAPAAFCTIQVLAAPFTTGVHLGALAVATDAAVNLDYVSLFTVAGPAPLTFSPPSLDFGSVALGDASSLSDVITNNTVNPITVTSITTTGDYASGGTCLASALVLAPGASCTLQTTFKPSATGPRPGSTFVSSSGTASALQIPLTGTGIQAKLITSAASLSFGTVVIGKPSSLYVTVSNTGSAPFQSLAIAATGDFSFSSPCVATTLAPGASCSVQVTFSPTAVGQRSGMLTISSSDRSSPLNVSLSGIGISAGGFALTVDGGASSSVTVQSGKPATYQFTLTPQNGFTGTVVLTCSAINPALYASCSLQPPTFNLAGTPQTGIAVINTLTSAAQTPRPFPLFTALLLSGLFGLRRLRKQARKLSMLRLIAPLVLSGCLLLAACGGGGASGNPALRYTDPGTYQYVVTATSTSGATTSASVTLNLTVSSR